MEKLNELKDNLKKGVTEFLNPKEKFKAYDEVNEDDTELLQQNEESEEYEEDDDDNYEPEYTEENEYETPIPGVVEVFYYDEYGQANNFFSVEISHPFYKFCKHLQLIETGIYPRTGSDFSKGEFICLDKKRDPFLKIPKNKNTLTSNGNNDEAYVIPPTTMIEIDKDEDNCTARIYNRIPMYLYRYVKFMDEYSFIIPSIFEKITKDRETLRVEEIERVMKIAETASVLEVRKKIEVLSFILNDSKTLFSKKAKKMLKQDLNIDIEEYKKKEKDEKKENVL